MASQEWKFRFPSRIWKIGNKINDGYGTPLQLANFASLNKPMKPEMYNYFYDIQTNMQLFDPL